MLNKLHFIKISWLFSEENGEARLDSLLFVIVSNNSEPLELL